MQDRGTTKNRNLNYKLLEKENIKFTLPPKENLLSILKIETQGYLQNLYHIKTGTRKATNTGK